MDLLILNNIESYFQLPFDQFLKSFPSDFNINFQDSNGFTLLHYACASNNISVIKLLLLHPLINVNLKNNLGETPLFETKSKKALKKLINDGKVDLNIRNKKGYSFLHKLTDIKMIKYLVRQPKLDTNIIDYNGESPIFSSNIDKLKLILTNFKTNINHQNFEGETILFKIDDNDLFEDLIKTTAIDINRTDNEGNSIIFYADIIKTNMLLKHKKINLFLTNNNDMSIINFIMDINKINLLKNYYP